MMKKKTFIKEIILVISIFFIIYFSVNNLSKLITDQIDNNDIVFVLYGNSIMKDINSYLITIVSFFINIINLGKYTKTYSLIRYEYKTKIVNNVVKDIIMNNTKFITLLNIIFCLNIIIFFDLSYINNIFIIYILVSSIVQILGLTIIMMVIVFVYLIIKNIIYSSIIIFAILTLQESFLRVIKSEFKSFLKILFLRCDFINYFNNTFIQVSCIFSFTFANILLYIMINDKLRKRDFLNEKKKY
ncbi:hypothetical protein SAMN04487886_108616 [Clostridium sp. DSM 8431]|uniref:hypothetical protein n=1 Tax=Clostridium sp. DSM 8431 TaxID=1761781 RepID=UPI0008E4F1BA|nr:hypothetical protein [Clostridium sp. DSM 8431]SFU64819.1 hypothetical protein SAMN04487886_108616 [Clostridium sp. DSM 8431]